MYTAENLKQFTDTISDVYMDGIMKRLTHLSDEELNKIPVLVLSQAQYEFVRAYGYVWTTYRDITYYSLGVGVFRIHIKTDEQIHHAQV